MTALLNWRVWAAVAAAIAMAAAGWKCYVMGGNAVQLAWDAAKLQQTSAQLVAEQAARTQEQALQTTTDKLRKTQNAQIIQLGIDLDAARAAVRLLHSTPRPADYAAPAAGTGAACGAASLFTEDADFLIGVAGEADQLRIAYQRCATQYDAARGAVK